MKRNTKTKIGTAGAIFIILALIEVIGRSSNSYSFIPLSQMVSILVSLLISGDVFSDIEATIIEIVAAFILSIVTGVMLGVGLWKSDYLNKVLDPFLTSYYAIPIFALYPVFIVFLGIGSLPIIITAWLYGFVFTATYIARGLRETSESYINVARSFNASKSQMVTKVYFPAALPYIFTGLRLCFVFCMIGVIATEFIRAGQGIGNFVSVAYTSYNTGEMYAMILFILVFAIIANYLFVAIENRLYARSEI